MAGRGGLVQVDGKWSVPFTQLYDRCYGVGLNGAADHCRAQPGTYKHPDPTLIYHGGHAERLGTKMGSSTATIAAAAARTSRNWHELFKKQKRN